MLRRLLNLLPSSIPTLPRAPNSLQFFSQLSFSSLTGTRVPTPKKRHFQFISRSLDTDSVHIKNALKDLQTAFGYLHHSKEQQANIVKFLLVHRKLHLC